MNNIINNISIANNAAREPLGWGDVNMMSARYNAAKRAGLHSDAKVWRVQLIEGRHIAHYCILAVMAQGHAPFASYFYQDGEAEHKVADMFGIAPSNWEDVEQFYG